MPTPSGHTQAIQASRVIGTSVYNEAGESVGTVKDIMLEKITNRIMFAVIGFGGFLGLGEKYHPVPWNTLDYNKEQGGYIIPYSKDELQAAPFYSIEELTKDDGVGARNASYEYYQIDPYW